jgi:hypothetical protein
LLPLAGPFKTLLSALSVQRPGCGHCATLGLAKTTVPVEHTRTISKADMVHNDYCPDIEVNPETYEVRADGELLTCEPAANCRWRSAISCSEARACIWHNKLNIISTAAMLPIR